MKTRWITILAAAGLAVPLLAGAEANTQADQEATPTQKSAKAPAVIRCGVGLEEPVLRPEPVDPERPIILPVEPMPPQKPTEPGPPKKIVDKPDAGEDITPEIKQWRELNQGQIVMVATVTSREMLMTTMSMPPRYAVQFSVGEDAELLRGEVEGKVEEIEFRYVTLDNESLPNVGDKLVLAVSTTEHAGGKMHVIEGLYRGDDDTLKIARQATSLPVGWRLNEEGKLVSPWAAVEDFKWPGYFNNWIKDRMKRPTCAVTDRPILAMPDGVKLEVEQIVPDDAKQYVNQFGDGKFKITLKNTTDKKIRVPALLAVQNNPDFILMDESLVVLHKGKPVFRPQSSWFESVNRVRRLSQGPSPVEIEPGKSFSFEFNTLELQGIDWPRGGSRVQFTFALGDQAVTSFFYYFSRHHDKLLPEEPEETEDDVDNTPMGD